MKHLKEIYSAGTHPGIKPFAEPIDPERPRLHGHNIANRLNQAGALNVLGAGIGGAAFSHKNHVFKIYHESNDNGGYHAYAHYAKQHQDDPHVPKIHAMGKVKGTVFHAVKMEHLHELHHSHPATHLLFDYGSDYGRTSYGIPKFHGKGSDVYRDLHETEHGQRLRSQFPSLHESMSNMARHLSDHQMDLHDGNFMVRRDGSNGGHGTPVITDPSVGILNR